MGLRPPTKLVKKRLWPVTTFHVAIALSFVIPSAAEGSAFRGPFLEMFFTRDHPMILFRMLRHRFPKSPRLEGYG